MHTIMFMDIFQSHCYSLEGVDEEHEYQRLMQSMEMVGFSHETQRKYVFSHAAPYSVY